jgi:hypothetical protein
MSNQDVSSQAAIPEFLADPAKQRPDQFRNHGIVGEFARRAGWIKDDIDWTPLCLTERQAQSLEHLIEFQDLLANDGLATTPGEIFDALDMLFKRGMTAFSHTELGEVVKAQRQ